MHTGVASYGALGHVLPSTSSNYFFPVHFTAAQILTATLCGCLYKHICILRQQLQQFSRGYTILVQRIILCHFICDKKLFHVVLRPRVPDPGDATVYRQSECLPLAPVSLYTVVAPEGRRFRFIKTARPLWAFINYTHLLSYLQMSGQ